MLNDIELIKSIILSLSLSFSVVLIVWSVDPWESHLPFQPDCKV